MNKYKLTIFGVLLGIGFSLSGGVSFANEEFVNDSQYLEGIESRNVSNLWNINEDGYTENSSQPNSSPLESISISIEKNRNNPLSPDDKKSRLNSNYGDERPTGGTIPFANF